MSDRRAVAVLVAVALVPAIPLAVAAGVAAAFAYDRLRSVVFHPLGYWRERE